MNNKLYVGRVLIVVGKIVLGISLASIIYIFYKFISIADIKITFAFFEAKFMSLFSSTYKVAYTNKQGIRVEDYIPIFLSDPYVSYILLKYKLALYNGFNLAFFTLTTIAIMIFYYRSEIYSIIEDFTNQHLREKQQVTKTNQDSAKPEIILQKKNKQPINTNEYQDL